MNFLKCSVRKAFTLAEMMIAFVISAFVMISVYSVFSAAISTKESLDSANDVIILSQSLQRLLSSDIRMMTSDKISATDGSLSRKDLIYISTQNSLTFNKSVAVNVYYYLEGGILYREESLEDMNYNMVMPLVEDISEAEIYTYDGSKYREEFNPDGVLFKFIFGVVSKPRVEFIVGRTLKI